MEENLEKAKSKKTFFRDKKNIAIIVLSLLLLISIGTTTNKNNISEKADANIASILEDKKDTTQEDKKRIEELENKNKILIEEKQNLETEKGILEEKNKELNTQIENLSKEASTKNSTQNNTQTNNTQTNNTQTYTTAENTNSAIVYVTKTGKKYHRAGCSYLKNSKIEMTLTDAKARGCTPCSKCY